MAKITMSLAILSALCCSSIRCEPQDSFETSDFFVESEQPFVPVLSSRQRDDDVRETPRTFGQINFQMQQAVARHREAVNQQQLLQNTFSGRRRQSSTRIQFPGPVSVSLETPSATVSLAPSIGGVLVANKQVLGPACVAR